jgi:integrase
MSGARTSVGLGYLHLHDLRHLGATLAAASGATTKELMARLGHATPAAALRYQHATEDRDRVIAEALSGLAIPAPVIPLAAAKRPRAESERARIGHAGPQRT